MELGSSSGMTAAHTRANLSKTTLRAKAFMNGKMVASLTVTGSTTKCTDKVCSLGPMAESSKAII